MTATDDLLARLMASRSVWEDAKSRPSDLEIEAAARIRALEAELSEARLTLISDGDRYDALHGVAMGLADAAKDALTFLRFDCPDFMTSHHPEMRVLESALAAWEKHNG